MKTQLSQVKEILTKARAVIVDGDLLIYPVIYDDEESVEDFWLELGDDNLQQYVYFDENCNPEFKNGSIHLIDMLNDSYEIIPLFEDPSRLN